MSAPPFPRSMLQVIVTFSLALFFTTPTLAAPPRDSARPNPLQRPAQYVARVGRRIILDDVRVGLRSDGGQSVGTWGRVEIDLSKLKSASYLVRDFPGPGAWKVPWKALRDILASRGPGHGMLFYEFEPGGVHATVPDAAGWRPVSSHIWVSRRLGPRGEVIFGGPCPGPGYDRRDGIVISSEAVTNGRPYAPLHALQPQRRGGFGVMAVVSTLNDRVQKVTAVDSCTLRFYGLNAQARVIRGGLLAALKESLRYSPTADYNMLTSNCGELAIRPIVAAARVKLGLRVVIPSLIPKALKRAGLAESAEPGLVVRPARPPGR